MSIYDYSVTSGDGREISLAEYKDKVILIVNTATGCGFTPQYEAIEKLYEDYHDQGLEVIDIPCNQFKNQAPGSDEEIQAFCQLHYHTQFLQMKKSDVNGPDALPLYGYLKEQKDFEGFGKSAKALAMATMLLTIDKDYKHNPDIKWNFTKFVVDRQGQVVARFEPTADMKLVEACIKELL
ncbi:glutathione peroxidase [Vaginisenegalia massiliensis]|uniref:glutathione peroxidase n=1 Tax=Vaginisenegalia massiliensis TaxID=2058294 RepID=UPI000F545CD7|nr:glutathione peroxidase [Vaginisenegalia massiliensis]